MMFGKLPIEHVDYIGNLRAKPGNIFQRVHREMEAAHLIEDDHVKRSGGRASSINPRT